MMKSASVHVLPPLPYADNVLDPVISENAIGFHTVKHHKVLIFRIKGLCYSEYLERRRNFSDLTDPRW